MSSNNKNIDQLFKQKLENFELSSQDSSWKMLQLLKEKNLRMKKVFFAKMLIGIVALFSFILFLFFPNDSNLDGSFGNDNNTKKENTRLKSELNNSAQNQINKSESGVTNSNILSFSNLVETKNKNVKQRAQLDLKEEKRLLNSESYTSYKALAQTDKEIQQKINQARINSSHDEYAPVINKNGSFMFFTSRRPVTNKEIRKGQGRERIYYTESGENGWTKAELLESPINSVNNFNSAVALSHDGKSLFIYRDDRNGNGDLFESRLIGSKWSAPEPLPAPINSLFHESSLSLSSDGKTLYFTSNRTGGSGGMDIWYTQKNKAGIWGTAKNLGNSINTENDEEGVFIHSDGKTLYFSSKGHKGMGGYDIYSSTLENGEWSKPVNLGAEINTVNDDVYFILEEDGSDAYYTSVNPNTPEKKDIFKIKYKPDFSKKANLEKRTVLTGTILEKNNQTPIKAFIEIYDTENQMVYAKIESDTKTGNFSIPLPIGKSYLVKIYKENYVYHTEKITTTSAENRQLIQKKILLDQLQNNSRFVLKELSAQESKDSFDQSINASMDNLYELLLLNPTLKIQLILETRNSKEFDSKNQQTFIDESLDYLKAKGINRSRISAKVVLNNQLKKQNSSTIFVQINSI